MNLEASPTPKKTLTRFICQELLYEFVTGRLDRERQTQVDEYLSDCRESQRELERLKRGLRYTSQAAHLQIEQDLRRALLDFEPQWKKTVALWTMQSSQRGWRLLPYVFLVLALVLGLFVLKPWEGRRATDVLLVEQVKTEPDLVSPPADVKVEPEIATPLVEASRPAATPPPLAAIVPNVGNPAPETPPLTTEGGVEDSGEATPLAGGTVERGEIEVGDFTNEWPAVRDKIVALGGKVAGNVELGWQRRSGEAYFHFSLPESNRSELELFLKTFGPVRFVSERAPRVMPEGQIRIILTVKDGGAHEGSSETP